MDGRSETTLDEDDKKMLFSRNPLALLRRYLSRKGEAVLRWYAETMAAELSLERAAEAAAATPDARILQVTWKALIRPRRVLWIDAILLVVGFLSLTMKHTVVEFQTYHAMPSARVRGARIRWLLATLAYPLVFFTLIVSLIPIVFLCVSIGLEVAHGRAFAKDMPGFVLVLLAFAAITCACYAGTVWLNYLKVPKAIRPIMRYPFRAAALASITPPERSAPAGSESA